MKLFFYWKMPPREGVSRTFLQSRTRNLSKAASINVM